MRFLKPRAAWRPQPEPERLNVGGPAPFDPARPLVIMHIPKTAGTALLAAMAEAITPAMTQGFDHCLFGGFTGFDTMAAELAATIHAGPATLPRGLKLVAGHFAFSTLAGAYPGATYVTLLREPWSRLLSLWLFWRQHRDADLVGWGSWSERVSQARLPLVDFLADPQLACQTDNLVTRMLLWPDSMIPAEGFIAPELDVTLLASARAQLRRFSFLELCENPELPTRLKTWLDVPLVLRRLNETRQIPPEYCSPLDRELSLPALELLEARSRLDLALWSEAAALAMPVDPTRLRQQTLLANISRYGGLMRG